MDNYELLLVAALLASPHNISCLPIEAKVFKDPKCRAVFEVIISLQDGECNEATVCQELQNRGWKNGDAVQFVSILNGFQGDAKFDHSLDAMEKLAARVNELHTKRVLYAKANSLLSSIKDLTISAADNIAALSELAMGAQLGLMDQRDPTAEGIIGRMIAQMDKGIPPAFSSGLPLFDAALAAGGIGPEQLWIITGQAKGMKSRIAKAICDNALSIGKSVTYVGLEDNERVYTAGIMAAHFGIPMAAFHSYYRRQHTPFTEQVEKAQVWMVNEIGKRWRVYDRKHKIGDWKKFQPIVRADKAKYGTDLIVLDHIQLYGRKYEVLSDITNALIDIAAEEEVALVVLSQISNETLREGFIQGALSTKGTGDLGTVAHAGIEVYKPDDNEFTASTREMDELQVKGLAKYVNAAKSLAEIQVTLKIVREGNCPVQTSCLFDAFSGKLLEQRARPMRISFR